MVAEVQSFSSLLYRPHRFSACYEKSAAIGAPRSVQTSQSHSSVSLRNAGTGAASEAVCQVRQEVCQARIRRRGRRRERPVLLARVHAHPGAQSPGIHAYLPHLFTDKTMLLGPFFKPHRCWLDRCTHASMGHMIGASPGLPARYMCGSSVASMSCGDGASLYSLSSHHYTCTALRQ